MNIPVISRCDSSWKGDRLIHRFCEDMHTKTDNCTRPVVSSKNIFYRNRYCARCNFDEVFGQQLTWVNVSLRCEQEPLVVSASPISDNSSLLLTTQTCTTLYNIMKPLSYFPKRRRVCSSTSMIDYCSYDAFKDKQHACLVYSAPQPCHAVKHKYKNTHCKQCQTTSAFIPKKGEPIPPVIQQGKPPPISVLVDFSSNGNSGRHVASEGFCPPGSVRDKIADICRAVSCPNGWFGHDGKCKVKIPLKNGTQYMLNSTYQFRLILRHASFVTEPLHTSLGHLQTSYNITDFNNNGSDVRSLVERECSILLHTPEIDTEKCDLSKSSNTCTEITFKNFTTNHFRSFIEFSNTLVSNFNITEILILRSDYNLCSSTKNFTEHRNLTHSYNISTYSLLNVSDENIMAFIWKRCRVSQSLLTLASVCNDTVETQCSLVSFTDDEFTKVNNSVILKSSGLILGPYEYNWNDSMIQVCINKLSFIVEGQQGTWFYQFNSLQSDLTLIGSCISIAFLLLTFLTYALFSDLQTLPGKSIMGLSISMAMAQLLFLMNTWFLINAYVCTAAAIILHYAWLVTFTWMSVLAYDVSTTISVKAGLRGKDEKNMAFKRYLTIAYLLPIVIICTCVCIDNLTALPFQYGGAVICWISPGEALLYSFALPLAALLLFNACFFVKTIVGLQTFRKATKSIEKNRENKSSLILYIKMSSLLGFTWLFGFVAALTGVTEFWYMFIIFNSLQGVFICLSFTFTQRVWMLYKMKLKSSVCRSSGQGKSVSSSNVSTTSQGKSNLETTSRL